MEGSRAGVAREDQLAPAHGEAAPAAALSGLYDDGMALRRARDGEGAARAEVLAPVAEAVDFLRVGEAPRRLVDDQRVVGPGVPVAMHHLQELVRAVVARVVLDDLLQPHVSRLDVVHRGDDVPGRAAARHQVERLEQPRDMEGVIVGRRVGAADAEPLGAHGDRHEAGDRVHLDAADAVRDGLGEAPAVELRHAQAVVEERELKLAGLEHPADAGVVVGRHEIVLRVRVAPGAREIRAVLRLQKPDHDHVAHDACLRRYQLGCLSRRSTWPSSPGAAAG